MAGCGRKSLRGSENRGGPDLSGEWGPGCDGDYGPIHRGGKNAFI